MAKPHSFGALRMMARIMKNTDGEFKEYLVREGYTAEERENIKSAFATLGTAQQIDDNRTF